jgi:hypothetical protein
VPATVVALGLAFNVLAGPRRCDELHRSRIGGWASLTIAGMILKIVPFLVWYRAYGPHVGRARVPTLASLGCRCGARDACDHRYRLRSAISLVRSCHASSAAFVRPRAARAVS